MIADTVHVGSISYPQCTIVGIGNRETAGIIVILDISKSYKP